MKKMGKRQKTPEQEIQELCNDIQREIAHWIYVNENGCQDPFYADGINMNLTRNHIIYDKRQIMKLCGEHGIPIPEEMYLPLPPKVDEYYMANLRQKERVKRLRQQGEELTTKRNKYDAEQLSWF